MTDNNPQTMPITGTPIYKRIMLKIGGEAIGKEGEMGIVPAEAERIARIVKQVRGMDVEVALVVGAGNLWRGSIGTEAGMERATADYMGMLATVLNALALRDALERSGVDTRVQTAFEMQAVAEPYIRLRAIRHLEKGRVVIMAGGTGNPFFTTDSAAALRGIEINADVVIKATKVDGIYDKDPMAHADAKRYDRLTFMDALEQRLRVMDATAITLCMENHLPIVVLNLWEEGALLRALVGEDVGTKVS